MVARTPPKLKKKMVAPLDPNQLRETVKKVEKCMARLEELQYITGGKSTRGYSKTSPRCNQESLRIRNSNGQKSPNGKLPSQIGEWKRMSLPAMLLGETVGEILQASQFAREILATVDTKSKNKTTTGDPKTPVTDSRRNSRLNLETTELNARRKREKQIIRSDPHSPLLQRAKSKINFKVSGSPPKKELEKENCRFPANRVSPKNRPWARKTVIFPNPLFHSSPNSKNQNFCRTKSPVIPRNHPTTPHKFLIKTPPAATRKAAATSSSSSVAKFQVKIRSPTISVSPTRPTATAAKKAAVSPPKKVSTVAKIRRSFSPSRLVSKIASPLKSRKLSLQRTSSIDEGGMMMMMNKNMNMMSGLKQRPSTPMHLSDRRI